MQVETMLRLYVECEKVQKTIKGAECSKCRLSKEVRLSMEAATPLGDYDSGQSLSANHGNC